MPQVSALGFPRISKAYMIGRRHDNSEYLYDLTNSEKSLEVWIDWVEKAVGVLKEVN